MSALNSTAINVPCECAMSSVKRYPSRYCGPNKQVRSANQINHTIKLLSMRDSATSAMRGWEQQKPDGFASELFLDQLILLES
jgi:hypothetical protein